MPLLKFQPSYKKSKVTLEQATTALSGSRWTVLLFLLPRRYIKCGWATPRPYSFKPKRPDTHPTGGWVGSRAVLDGSENLACTEIRSPDRPNRNESLYQLLYPGPHVPFHNLISYNHVSCLQFLSVHNRWWI